MQVQLGITEILIGQQAQPLHGLIHRGLPFLNGIQQLAKFFDIHHGRFSMDCTWMTSFMLPLRKPARSRAT